MRTDPIRAALAAFAFIAAGGAALAQGGPRALVSPGQPVPAQLLELEAGAIGRDLAGFVGKRPVLGVYWRPKDPLSEQALFNAQAVFDAVAPEGIFFPVAVLAASQPQADIPERLTALGLKHLGAREDAGGRLARVLGVRAIPSFFLIDAGAVLRAVGGADITQGVPNGLSIAEALALAGKGAAVPTLGVMPTEPIYRLLGQKLPADLAATEMDGATFRKLALYLGKGKKVLLFYWSPQCPHCRDELPKLGAWYGKQNSENVTLLTVARGDAATLRSEAAKLVADTAGLHLLDVDRSIGARLVVRETPTTFLVAPDGEILAIRTGSGIDWEGWLRGAAGPRTRAATN